MANNPNVNKVVYGNQTVMDITDTTAETSDVAEGEVFYNRSGARSVGTGNYYSPSDTAETAIDDADYFPFYDTSVTGKRKTLWSNIKDKLKTYFDGIYALFSSTEEELRNTVGWTGKNLLNSVIESETEGGITVDANADGSFHVYGTSSPTGDNYFYLNPNLKIYEGDYIFSCEYSGTTDGNYPSVSATLYAADGTRKTLNFVIINPSDMVKTGTIEGTDYVSNIRIAVVANKTVDCIMRPMIRKASIKDSTFEPYHGTVDEVKADKASLATVATSNNYEDLDNLPDLDSFYSTDDAVGTLLDNADNFPFYDASDTAKKNITWNILKSLMKSGISTTSVAANSADLITSGGVYNALFHVVGTIATVSAGQSVRIPASGTDDRITTNVSYIYIPFADSDDGKPVKFPSMSVYSGYLTITVAQALTAQYIGVIIVNT